MNSEKPLAINHIIFRKISKDLYIKRNKVTMWTYIQFNICHDSAA